MSPQRFQVDNDFVEPYMRCVEANTTVSSNSDQEPPAKSREEEIQE